MSGLQILYVTAVTQILSEKAFKPTRPNNHFGELRKERSNIYIVGKLS